MDIVHEPCTLSLVSNSDSTATSLTTDCRDALARMAHGKSVLRRTVNASARDELLDRGLVHEHMHQYLGPTSIAAGYTAAPHTFIA